jgi:hypothetical protein
MKDLLAAFDVAMLHIYQRAKSEADYTAAIFLRMLNDRRGLATAKYLINCSKLSDGYTQLYERGRIDLTVEVLVVEDPKWHELFSPEEIAAAAARLRKYGYNPKPRQ